MLWQTNLATVVQAKHNQSHKSLQPKHKKPCNNASQAFSDGEPFVGPVLLPRTQHERNGCYSSSNNPNVVSNPIRAIQI